MGHTLWAKEGSDGKQMLTEYGFEIIDNPVWYFQKPGYVDVDIA